MKFETVMLLGKIGAISFAALVAVGFASLGYILIYQ